MTMKTYLTLCCVVPVVWVLGLLFISGFSDVVEQVMLGLLVATAS